MQGRVTNYNAGTGEVEFTVNKIGGPVGSENFNSWTVTNLSTGDTGSSSTSRSISAVSDPAGTTTFTVSPAAPWLAVGHRILVAHFETDVIELENVGTLWNARERLSFGIANAFNQRTFNFPAADSITGGRFIKTWIDSNGNGVAEPAEFIDFSTSDITSINYGFFNVATEADADNLVNYIRGTEITGYRNRTVDYDGSGPKVMRLADVVNATPTIVGAPLEGLDLLYKDASYALFKKQYAKEAPGSLRWKQWWNAACIQWRILRFRQPDRFCNWI